MKGVIDSAGPAIALKIKRTADTTTTTLIMMDLT
jgi:hypothetical protein